MSDKNNTGIQDKPAQQAPDAPEKKRSVGREILSWIVTLAIAIGCVLLVRTFVFEPITVDGPSMNDTLFTGDRLFVTKYDCLGDSVPERGSAIICRYPDSSDNYVKRLIGLPGDTIQITGGVTYINGVAQSEDYIEHPATRDFGPLTLGDGEYFVMGDNRGNSTDSRIVGPITAGQITGTVRYRFWPLDQMGTIEVQSIDA